MDAHGYIVILAGAPLKCSYISPGTVLLSLLQKKSFFPRTHFAQFSDEASNTVLKFISQTVNFNESLSYSEIYMEIRANSAIMLQSKSEAN